MRYLRFMFLSAVLSLASLAFTPGAWADALDDAKAAGLVGETRNGFIAAVGANPSREIAALIDDINTRRLARYGEIAATTGGTLAQVGILVGQRQIESAASGSFVQGTDGAWVRVP